MAQVKFLEITERYQSTALPSESERLGLHVTSDELAVWQTRVTDNVNTINGQTFQSIYNTRIKADADSFVAQSHPGGDGHWEGYTAGGCVPQNDQSVNPGTGGTGFGRGNGAWIMRSAFTYLLTGNTAYADPVKAELLQQITETGTQWSNTSKWCTNSLGGGNILEIVPWVVRLMFAFDYLRAGGYSFGGTNETAIMQWFTDAATCWSAAQQSIIDNSLAYPGINNTPQDLTCVGAQCTTNIGYPTHLGGIQVKQATYFSFFNQLTDIPVLEMGVGLMISNTTFINRAAAYFTAFIKKGIFDDGSFPDYIRWADSSPARAPGSMWAHAGAVMGHLIAVADMYARSGNTSLYDLTAPAGALGSSGTTIDLESVIDLFARLANGTTVYEADDGRDLTWDNANGDYYHDFVMTQANLYYQNSNVTTAVQRNIKVGSGANTGDCSDNQYGGCFSGAYSAQCADFPFMFGKMHDNSANPYL